MLRGIHKLCDKARWDEAIDSLTRDQSGEGARAEAATTGGWGEWTPLHLACKHNPPLLVVNALLDAAPIAAETFDVHDNLPLHHAVEAGCSDLGVLESLVEVCSEAAEVATKDGETPLMISFRRAAASSPTSFPLEREVEILAYPTGEALMTECPNEAGTIILHQAVKHGAPVEILRHLVQACPESTCVPTNTEENALLLSVSREMIHGAYPSPSEISLLAGASNGEPALFTDPEGYICLHKAVRDGAPLDVLRALIEANPESLTWATPAGSSALTIAFARNWVPSTAEIVLLTDKPNGAAALVVDSEGKTILHRAVESSTPSETLRAIVQASPRTKSVRSISGETALMILLRQAVGNERPLPSLDHAEALMDSEIIRLKYMEGKTILHHAIEASARSDGIQMAKNSASKTAFLFSFVQMCLKVAPSIVLTTDDHGISPLHLAIQSNASLDIIMALLGVMSEEDKVKALQEAIEKDMPLNFLQIFLAAAPELTTVEDSNGNTVLQYATSVGATREIVQLLAKAELLHVPTSAQNNTHGRIPLHDAVEKGASMDVLRALVEANPSSLTEMTSEGHIALTLAFKRAAAKNTFPSREEILLLGRDDSALLKNTEGKNTLHQAVESEAPFETLQAIVQVSPHTTAGLSDAGETALMMLARQAVEKNQPFPSEELVKILLNKEAVTLKDKSGKTILHHSIEMGAPLDIIEMFVKVDSSLVSKSDKRFKTPLHMELEGDMSAAIIQSLLEAAPEAAEKQDANGLTPLHHAVALNAPLIIVKTIAHAAPKTVGMEDDRGKTPLRLALDNRLQLKKINALVDAFPDAIGMSSSSGENSLHYSIKSSIPLDILTLLAGASSSCVTAQDINGLSPIQLAVRDRAPVTTVEALLDASPEAIKIADSNGDTLLPYSINLGSPIEIVQLLAKATSASGKQTESTDMPPSNALPLHNAVEKGKSLDVLRALVEANPNSLTWTSTDRNESAITLAFKRAAANGTFPSKEEIVLLTDKPNGEAALVVDEDGKTILHRAVESNAPHTVLETIVQVSPRIATVKSRAGETALMTLTRQAIEKQESFECEDVVKALMERNGEVMVDNEGKTTLYRAIELGAPFEIIVALAESARHMVGLRGSFGKAPLQLAIEENVSADIVQALLTASPDSANIQDKSGNSILHLAVLAGASMKTLEVITQALPAAIELKNRAGETPLMLHINEMSNDSSATPSQQVLFLLSDSFEGESQKFLDKFGNNIIHRGVELGLPYNTLKALVSAAPPQFLTEENKDGLAPLQLRMMKAIAKDATSSATSVNEINLLMDSYGTVAIKTDTDGNNLLHQATLMGATNDVLETIVKLSPSTASALNLQGKTPLSLQMVRLASEEKELSYDDLRCVIDEEGNALRVRDPDGKIALHIALSSNAPLETMNALVDAAPSSVQIEDRHGRLVLHHCVASGAVNFIDILKNAYSGAMVHQDQMGMTPLHLALTLSTDSLVAREVLEKLLGEDDVAEKIARISDSQGRLPLHCACQNVERIPIEMTMRLMNLYRESLSFKTKCGELPIDLIEAKRKTIRDSEDGAFCIEHMNTLSDLAFSYNPDVAPYNTEFNRIERFTNSILNNLSGSVGSNGQSEDRDFIEESYQRFWIWICTAYTPDGSGMNQQYYETISSIMKSVNGLSIKKKLINIEVETLEGRIPLKDCVSERIRRVLAPSNKDVLWCLKDVAQKIRQAHSRGILYGNVTDFKISRRKEGGYDIVRQGVPSSLRNGERVGSSAVLASVSTRGLSPLMIAKLNMDGYLKYRKYWKTVSNDAETSNIVCQLDIDEVTETVQGYLGDANPGEATFTDLLGRFAANDELWERIRPRRFGSDVYVVKCFYQNQATGLPLCPEKLPYGIVRANMGQDLWSFGLVLYESLTGSPLFGSDSPNGLLSGEECAALTGWDSYYDYASRQGKSNAVRDPVALALLEKLLHHNTYVSMTSIDTFLDHPFFAPGIAKSKQQSLDILANEKQRREKKQREAAELKERKEEEKGAEKARAWMDERTEVINTVSLHTKAKFEASTWNQWGSAVSNESLIPTAFVLLPYRLVGTSANNTLTVSLQDIKLAQKLGVMLSDILRYVRFVGSLPLSKPKPFTTNTALWRYNELNEHIHSSGHTYLGCCHDIVSRVENAKEALCAFLPDGGDHEFYCGMISLLVDKAVKNTVSVDSCRVVLKKVSEAERAMQSLIDTAGINGSAKTAHDSVEEQIDALLGLASMRNNQIERRQCVDQALLKLVQSFSENSFEMAKRLLAQKVEDLCSIYTSSGHCYLYLVDEMTGLPVKGPSYLSSSYPLKIDTRVSDDLTTLLPCMLPTLKTVCFSNATIGLASAIGLSFEQIPASWSEMLNLHPSNSTADSTAQECNLIHASLCDEEVDLFCQYVSTILLHDVRRDFGGMTRIRSPCGEKYLWTIENNRGCTEKELEHTELVEYVKKDRNENMDRAMTIVEATETVLPIEIDVSNSFTSSYDGPKSIRSRTNYDSHDDVAGDSSNRSVASNVTLDTLLVMSRKKVDNNTADYRKKTHCPVTPKIKEESECDDSENVSRNATPRQLRSPKLKTISSPRMRMFKSGMKRGQRPFKGTNF